jgi:acetolactate decarboxylase
MFGILPIFAQNPEVKSAGEMRKIIHDADLSAKIRLDTLAREHLFAIGTVDSLRGEISIVNGKPLVSSIQETFIRTDTTLNHSATLLVYTYVKNWKVVTIEQDLNNFEEFELLIKRLASENGIDVTKPFPFMARTWVKNMSFHVIDWQSGFLHTADTHKQFAHELWHSAEVVMLAGFYSENHQGIFTPYNSKMHVHTITSNPMTCGHLETIETYGKVALYFPDNNNTVKTAAVEAMKLEEY